MPYGSLPSNLPPGGQQVLRWRMNAPSSAAGSPGPTHPLSLPEIVRQRDLNLLDDWLGRHARLSKGRLNRFVFEAMRRAPDWGTGLAHLIRRATGSVEMLEKWYAHATRHNLPEVTEAILGTREPRKVLELLSNLGAPGIEQVLARHPRYRVWPQRQADPQGDFVGWWLTRSRDPAAPQFQKDVAIELDRLAALRPPTPDEKRALLVHTCENLAPDAVSWLLKQGVVWRHRVPLEDRSRLSWNNPWNSPTPLERFFSLPWLDPASHHRKHAAKALGPRWQAWGEILHLFFQHGLTAEHPVGKETVGPKLAAWIKNESSPEGRATLQEATLWLQTGSVPESEKPRPRARL